jgi:hypothetical protein
MLWRRRDASRFGLIIGLKPLKIAAPPQTSQSAEVINNHGEPNFSKCTGACEPRQKRRGAKSKIKSRSREGGNEHVQLRLVDV